MSVNLITGYAGTAHITAAGDGAVNAGMFGSGKYVLNIGEKFGYEIISNNLIRIKSGYAIDQGRKIELAVNDYEEVEIDNGLQGVKRCDLIVIHYEKSLTTGIETATMKVIKGTSGDDYTDPAYTSGDIINGANEDDFLLYRVKINGLNIETVESLFSVTDSILNLLKEQAKTISGLNTNLKYRTDIIDEIVIASATTVTAYIENGTVVIRGKFPIGKTGTSVELLFVPTKYMPRVHVGAHIEIAGSPSDINKVMFAEMAADSGKAAAWINSALSSTVYFTFVYPLRTT